MRDNKIVSGRIVLISLSDYEDDKKLYVDYHSRDIGERIYNIVSTNLCLQAIEIIILSVSAIV